MNKPLSVSCPRCGTTADRTDNFCETCGLEIAAVRLVAAGASSASCMSCGSEQISADGYCEQCGSKAPAARDHFELDLGTLAGITDRGLRHHRNEDAMALAASHTPSGAVALAAVCDGISTSERPDAASLAAANAALSALLAELRAGAPSDDALRTAVTAADTAVRELAADSLNAPAATFVAAVVSMAEVATCWVGDSRAYWLPVGTEHTGARSLTRDDSLASALVSAGALPEDEAIASPHGHVVTRWLGADAAELEPHIATFEPPGPGVVLLCSDGLWNYMPDAAGLSGLALPKAQSDMRDAAADLIAFALRSGGRDNITAVLIAYPPELPSSS